MGKKTKDGLGRALIKDRFGRHNNHKKTVDDNSMLHTTEINDGYEWGRLNLQSVTAESSLQEFLSTAELAEKEFQAEKLNVHYVKSAPTEVQLAVIAQKIPDTPLTIPRRPQWIPGITPEEQLTKEKESFLDWRRQLAELQEKEGAAVTPYERNLELWRQLWRTLERSDIVLLLLDARNPLVFRCADLEKYATEQNCRCILLLNKADLIGEYDRKCWAEYFNREGIQVVFFSAAKKVEKDKVITEEKSHEVNEDSDNESDGSEESIEEPVEEEQVEEEEWQYTPAESNAKVFRSQQLKEINEDIQLLDDAVSRTAVKLDRIQDLLYRVLSDIKIGNTSGKYQSPGTPKKRVSFAADAVELPILKDKIEGFNSEKVEAEHEEKDNATVLNTHEIMDREKLLEFLKGQNGLTLKNPPRITIGMIGYPNVGKSSTVNVLMQTKKVSVSSMPGHTRHIQSLMLDDEVDILDCPGLVLPAYAVAPDLLLTAVLPIDQMRSHDTAVRRLCELVERKVLERKYGLLLPKSQATGLDKADYKEVLTSHAYIRGFMTASGQPDVSRSARLLLKDAASGRLQWTVLPPDVGRALNEDGDGESSGQKRKPTPREARMVEGWISSSAELDKHFFASNKATAHTKGKVLAGLSGYGSGTNPSTTGKPWKQEKKHANKNKKEKLRRVYAHLDQH